MRGAGDCWARGLSPRVRGNQRLNLPDADNRRSIPACAGEPTLAFRAGIARAVYPRVCGGTGAVTRLVVSQSGLSPRVRGNPGQEELLLRQNGSIPACAGEPILILVSPRQPPVYPRVCGGTDGTSGATRLRVGLSPRVRGAHNPAVVTGGVCGLSPRVRGNRIPVDAGTSTTGSIPACAGEPVAVVETQRP